MSTFEVLVRQIDDIYDHPNGDRLSIVKVLGYEAITNKIDGKHRFQKGDLIVYVPEAAIVPEDVLREYGFWDEAKGKGVLSGKSGNRVKIIRLRGKESQGLIFPVVDGSVVLGGMTQKVNLGDDVAEFFAITKYDPPIPAAMSGEIVAVPEMAFVYDIENWQNFPGFLDNDEVEATEKIHGTNFRICYHPDVNDPHLFGDGNVGIASKGLGADGKMFKNNRSNLGSLYRPTEDEIRLDRKHELRYQRSQYWGVRHILKWMNIRVYKPRTYQKSNLYVRAAIEADLINRVTELGKNLGVRIDLFGEVFGAGVQNLDYGQKHPIFRAFDIAINRRMANSADKAKFFLMMGVERVPVLYRGPWNTAELIKHRDGKTLVAGDHIREGIVVTAIGSQEKREVAGKQLRPFLKMVSPAYLTRYDDGTAIQ